MIKFENACDIAYNYFKKLSTEYVLTSALENDAYWIFYGGILDKIEYGGKGIKIKKSDGAIETFQLPKELKLLHNSVEVPLADSFKR